jgi:hypothetical protein
VFLLVTLLNAKGRHRESHRAYRRIACARHGERIRNGRLCEEGAGFAGLRGPELLTSRPIRAAISVTVFVFGVLAGAGLAAWVMPPI